MDDAVSKAERDWLERILTMATKVDRSLTEETQSRIQSGEIPKAKVESYQKLLDRIEKEILPHEVIVNNQFTRWFKDGNFDQEDVKHFLVQFSVFSNLFIEAQLKKVINSPNLEAMHISKEILMNELGVVFNRKAMKPGHAEEQDSEGGLVGTEGTIEGGTFRFAAAHFEWLLRMVSYFGLGYNDVGKRRHGTKPTVFFCDELSRLYGSEDPHVAMGASFAVENWANAGFWKELIAGFEIFKARECPKLPLAFFTWHDKVEDQHAAHTWSELQAEYFSTELDEGKFISGAKEMLNGVLAFWKGLNEDRLRRENVRRLPTAASA
jgi:hypothetical protein